MEPGQLGYSIDANGVSLTGSKKRDWKSEWRVIEYEDCGGDPIFLDSKANNTPIYTAEHGMGEWTPLRIADSFEAFQKSLTIVSEIAIGRENPMLLEKNP